MRVSLLCAPSPVRLMTCVELDTWIGLARTKPLVEACGDVCAQGVCVQGVCSVLVFCSMLASRCSLLQADLYMRHLHNG